MKCLKIEHGKGFYAIKQEVWKPIDEINKEDLLAILALILDNDEVIEMDQYDDSLLQNAAHKIIYRNIYNKFASVDSQKEHFVDEKMNLFKSAIDRYSVELGSPETH